MGFLDLMLKCRSLISTLPEFMKIVVVATVFLFILMVSFSSITVAAVPPFHGITTTNHMKSLLGNENFGTWKTGNSEYSFSALTPGPGTDEVLPKQFVLAEKRTNRRDILRGFTRYRDGWDIANRHYWASVGFTGAPGFVLSVIWFVCFGLALVVHHCFGWHINIQGRGSHSSDMICLILLIIFTCSAAIGCILLSIGQDEFHSEASHTLKYVINQSDYTVQTLRNVTEYLSLAKNISVAQIFLPLSVMNDIDKLNVDLKNVADTLSEKTSENSHKITKVFNAVRSALIAVATVMLLLTLLGLILSILGHKHAIHIFIFSGWLLVSMTFILCGVFVILDNAVSDTCMAMGEWVDNPHAETALSNILPCVDQKTTNQTLIQSKIVINDIVNVVNTFIYTYANSNPPDDKNSYYYNQSGPPMPPLCYPYDSSFQHRECGMQEVSMQNASTVWQNYICTVATNGTCNSTGRATPDMLTQLVNAVNEMYGLEHYAPPLLSFQDCNFVRETFKKITLRYCPLLEHHLCMVDAGLGLVSVGVMLCLVLWILYANRPQREEAFARGFCRYISSVFNINNDYNPGKTTLSNTSTNGV